MVCPIVAIYLKRLLIKIDWKKKKVEQIEMHRDVHPKIQLIQAEAFVRRLTTKQCLAD